MSNSAQKTAYGDAAINTLLDRESKPTAPSETSEGDMQLVLQSFRLLIADLCEQFGMGIRNPLLYLDVYANNLRTSRFCDRNGSDRGCFMEVYNEICPKSTGLVQ